MGKLLQILCHPCIGATLRIFFHIVAYLLLEAISFFLIAIGSTGFSFWLSRVIFLVTRYQLGDVGQAYIFSYAVGFLASWRQESQCDLFNPQFLQASSRRYPKIFGCFKFTLALSAFVTCLGYLCHTYTTKYPPIHPDDNFVVVDDGDKRSLTKEVFHLLNEGELYSNDIQFLAALGLLVSIYSRSLEACSQFNWNKVGLEQGGEPKTPGWIIYLFYFCALLVLELVLAAIIFLLLTGLAIVVQVLLDVEWISFVITCEAGLILGLGSGDLEIRMSVFDDYFEHFEPYFTVIHWDVRQNVLVFSLIPLVARWYFEMQFSGDMKSLFNYTFYVGCIAASCFYFAKCQRLFASLIPIDEMRLWRSGRVHPSPSQENIGPALPEDYRIGTPFWYFALFRAAVIGYYFPFTGSDRTDEQTSISTGTCTTLVNRISGNDPNNNSESGGLAPQHTSSGPQTSPVEQFLATPTCPRSVSNIERSQGTVCINIPIVPTSPNQNSHEIDGTEVAENNNDGSCINGNCCVIQMRPPTESAHCDPVQVHLVEVDLSPPVVDPTKILLSYHKIPEQEEEKAKGSSTTNEKSVGDKLIPVKSCSSLSHIPQIRTEENDVD